MCALRIVSRDRILRFINIIRFLIFLILRLYILSADDDELMLNILRCQLTY